MGIHEPMNLQILPFWANGLGIHVGGTDWRNSNSRPLQFERRVDDGAEAVQ
ncbi:hypothetical protein [Candidatus Cyanaurora vandensis]|uniref:hypothetical protein n=1 Tax=Candidatus Cyanaurora vandensis TaxID=2714958 RepID=UPI00257C22A3|nr:hypothetical protein [Candidatus Cyanaurora vandensis]